MFGFGAILKFGFFVYYFQGSSCLAAVRNTHTMETEKRIISDADLSKKIGELRTWISSQSLVPELLSDKTLTLFLHSCMYDVESCKSTLTSYYKLRIRSPEYFSERNPSAKNLIIASEIGYSVMLPGTTNEGYKVIMIGYFHSDTTNYVFNDVIKRFLMTVDMWLSKSDICPGYLILVECQNSAFGHFTAAPFDSLKKLCAYFQEALPVILKGVVFINISPAVNMLLTIVNPIISKKLTSLIQRYPRGSSEYLNQIPLQMLPKKFGGDAPSIQELQDSTQNELVEYEEWFKKEDYTIRSIAEKNAKITKKNSVEGLF